MEDRTGGCYDGGLLEISIDGGATWTQLPSAVMETDPYDGPISTCCSNPLQNLDTWCGDPQGWLKSVVNLDAYAGETARFRFRLGTDSSVSREGWYVDDLYVQSCEAGAVGLPFDDGFESGDSSAWSATVP
jgi:bacillopeptidase F (M6 metalloprotease family)